MSSIENRRNVVTGEMIIVSPGREKSLEQLMRRAPRDWSGFNAAFVDGTRCPFCAGHEAHTPPEVMVYRQAGTPENTPGWWVRVVPNLGPAADEGLADLVLNERRMGICGVTNGYGFHYVIVESPTHDIGMQTMDLRQVCEVVHMWRAVSLMLAAKPNIAHISLFKNVGPTAGASQPHSHSQAVALPVLPAAILTELRGAKIYHDDHKKCPFCEEIAWELSVGYRIVAETSRFVAWCPYVSMSPYQIRISPKGHQSSFTQIGTYGDSSPLVEFADLLRQVLARMRSTLNDPDWNLYFHTAPSNNSDLPYSHWYCQAVPVTPAIQAGFEKGNGVIMLPRSPESAAKDLRDVKS